MSLAEAGNFKEYLSMKYLRKPKEVDIIFYDGGNLGEVRKFCPGMAKCGNYMTTGDILIPIADGSDKVTMVNSVIIKDEQGDFSVLRSGEFNKTHELPKAYNTLKAKADLFSDAIILLGKCCGKVQYEHSYESLHNAVLDFLSKAKEL
jgi:hypothetical protein